MLGLIKKDLLMSRNTLKLYLIIFVFYIFLAINGNDSLSFIPPFVSILLMFSTFSYDNYNKFECFALSFPNGRRNLVLSKYLATIILIIGTTIITIIASLLIGISNNTINYQETFLTFFYTIMFSIIFLAIIYPFIFKFGIEKARIIIFILIFGLSFLIGALFNSIDTNFLTNAINFISYNYLLLPIIVIVLLIVSYLLSKHFYLKKEF